MVSIRAAVLRKLNSPLSFEDVRIAKPLSSGQVLVRVLYSGICGKQVDELRGIQGADPHLPHLLGHEGVGKVVEVGPDVLKVKVDDFVILHWMKGTGLNSEVPQYIDARGQVVNAGWITTFNDYSVVSENRLTSVSLAPQPEDSLLGCAVPTAWGTVNNVMVPTPGDRVLVVGTGGVGSLAVIFLREAGCLETYAFDQDDKAAARAVKLGAHSIKEITPPTKRDPRALNESRIPQYFDKVMVTVGNGEIISKAFECLASPGHLVCIGVPNQGSSIILDSNNLFHDKKIEGVIGGRIKPDVDIPRLQAWLRTRSAESYLENVTVLPFSDLNEALSLLQSGSPGRQILDLR